MSAAPERTIIKYAAYAGGLSQSSGGPASPFPGEICFLAKTFLSRGRPMPDARCSIGHHMSFLTKACLSAEYAASYRRKETCGYNGQCDA